jgi:hypothetical protein
MAARRDVAGRDWLAMSRDAAVDSDVERKQKEAIENQIYCGMVSCELLYNF